MISDTDLAYAAGVIDADGCITIAQHKNWHWIVVQVGMCDPIVVAWLTATFGGVVHTYADKKARRSPQNTWAISAKTAEGFLNSILPWLKLKRKQARVALFSRSLVRDGHKLSTSVIQRRESCRQAISTLNQQYRLKK